MVTVTDDTPAGTLHDCVDPAGKKETVHNVGLHDGDGSADADNGCTMPAAVAAAKAKTNTKARFPRPAATRCTLTISFPMSLVCKPQCFGLARSRSSLLSPWLDSPRVVTRLRKAWTCSQNLTISTGTPQWDHGKHADLSPRLRGSLCC
jgi:hypothetical protein